MRSDSCSRQWMPSTGPSCSFGRAISIFLPVVVVLILLPAIAFADPPDPSWVAGIYDGADGDDIVSLVYDTTAAKAAALPEILPHPLSETSRILEPSTVPDLRASQDSRGPPSTRLVTRH
jgi:hypothetical protein